MHRLGVSHAAVFGLVARGDATEASDVDVLVELDDRRPMGIFEYARLKLYISEILDGAGDVMNHRTIRCSAMASCAMPFMPSKTRRSACATS